MASHNQITSLPVEVCTLKNLCGINLQQNQLETLPDELGQLENLTQLVTTTYVVSNVLHSHQALSAGLSDWLMEVLCLLCLVEGPVQQPSGGPAFQPGPPQVSAETEPVSQQAQMSACLPGPAHK